MSIPIVGQFGDQLGGYFEKMGSALGKINDPDAELREKMRILQLQNPKLHQDIINQEQLNPGSMTGLLPQAPRFWGGTDKPDMSQSVEDGNADEITRATQEARQKESELSGLDPNSDAYKKAKERVDFIRQQLAAGKVGTDLDLRQKKAATESAEKGVIQQDQAIDLSKYDLLDKAIKEERRIKLQPIISTLSTRNITKDVEAVMSGKKDMNDVAEAYMFVPEYAKLFQDAFTIGKQREMQQNHDRMQAFIQGNADKAELRQTLYQSITKHETESKDYENQIKELSKENNGLNEVYYQALVKKAEKDKTVLQDPANKPVLDWAKKMGILHEQLNVANELASNNRQMFDALVVERMKRAGFKFDGDKIKGKDGKAITLEQKTGIAKIDPKLPAREQDKQIAGIIGAIPGSEAEQKEAEDNYSVSDIVNRIAASGPDIKNFLNSNNENAKLKLQSFVKNLSPTVKQYFLGQAGSSSLNRPPIAYIDEKTGKLKIPLLDLLTAGRADY
jgi:hypothetical protein